MFCTLCTGGSHKPAGEDESVGGEGGVGSSSEAVDKTDGGSGSKAGSPTKRVPANSSTLDHTVIPFSIAIKRMSEILIYKANECRAKVRARMHNT